MKWAICSSIKHYANSQGKSVAEVAQEWDMYPFMGSWDDNNEVLVPSNMPVPSHGTPGIVIAAPTRKRAPAR